MSIISTSIYPILDFDPTPEAIIDTIEKSVQTVMAEQIVKDKLANVITDTVVSDRKAFGKWVVDERTKWGALIKDLKITAQ